MPAANDGGKWFLRAHLFIVGVFVFGVVVIGVAAAVFNASPIAQDASDAPAVAATDAPVSIMAPLRVGDCFDLDESDDGLIEDVSVRACDQEHQYELFLTYSVPGVSYPVDSEWETIFEDHCPPAFVEYVGSPFGGGVLDIYWIVPTRDGWHQGDHTLQCAVYHPDIPRLTKPLKDAGRVGTGTDI